MSNIQEFGCTDIARCTLGILAAVDRHSLPVVDKDGARISARGYAEGCWELRLCRVASCDSSTSQLIHWLLGGGEWKALLYVAMPQGSWRQVRRKGSGRGSEWAFCSCNFAQYDRDCSSSASTMNDQFCLVVQLVTFVLQLDAYSCK